MSSSTNGKVCKKRQIKELNISPPTIEVQYPRMSHLPMDFCSILTPKAIPLDWEPTKDTKSELQLVKNISVKRDGKVEHRKVVPFNTLTEFTNSFGHSGYPAKRTVPRTSKGKQYGEDVVISTDSFIGCFDGHFTDSEILSAASCDKCHEMFTTESFKSQLLNLLVENKHSEIEDFITTSYNNIRSQVNKLPEAQFTGTTVATCHYFAKENRRWVIFVNIGDSECCLVNNYSGQVLVTSNSHAWDNHKVYQQYVDSCLEKKLEPKPAIYGRFNNGMLGSYLVPDKDNRCDKPYHIFDIKYTKKLLRNL